MYLGTFSHCSSISQTECREESSPSAYPHLSSGALDDLQHDLTTVLHQTLSHPSLHPKNLGIIPRKKSWLLNLDLLVTAEAGNIYDALFLAARAALWDTKVPRTRSVEYKTPKTFLSASGDMDVDQDTRSGFDTRHVAHATDFELPDYWDEGEILEGRERWPVAVTLNLVSLLFPRLNASEEIIVVTHSTLSRCNFTRRGLLCFAITGRLFTRITNCIYNSIYANVRL